LAAGPLFFGSTIWTFNWNPPYEEVLRRLAGTGCIGFELPIWSAETLAYYTPDRIRALKAIADGEGLELTNVFCNLVFDREPHAATSRADLDAWKRGVDTAVALGSPIVTSMTPYPFNAGIRPILQRPTAQEWTAAVEPQWDWAGEYDVVVEGFARACETAATAGLRVAVEPHPYRWVSSGQGMARLIERVGAGNLGFNFDPSHIFPAGDMPHYLVLALGGYIFNTHFSDNDGHTNAHWRPGRGKIDWKAVLEALAAIGYSGPITLELEDAPGASHWTHFREATPAFDEEMRRGIAYLAERAAELGITIQQRKVK
jgi:sugar phosphate isomerase/epimerase